MKLSEYEKLDFAHRSNVLRNTLVGLSQFGFVSIVWEEDRHTSNATGENCGEWVVEIHTHDRREIVRKGDDLEDLLISADEEASEANAEYWRKRDEAKKAALAKLSCEDRRALGLLR